MRGHLFSSSTHNPCHQPRTEYGKTTKKKKKQGAEQYLLSSNFLWNFLEDNLKKSARVSTIGPLSSSVWVWLWSAARGPALLKSQNKGGLLLKSRKADAHTFSYPPHTDTPVSPVTDVCLYVSRSNLPQSDALLFSQFELIGSAVWEFLLFLIVWHDRNHYKWECY